MKFQVWDTEIGEEYSNVETFDAVSAEAAVERFVRADDGYEQDELNVTIATRDGAGTERTFNVTANVRVAYTVVEVK